MEDLQQKRAMREQHDKLLKQKDQECYKYKSDHELIISGYFSTPKQSKIMSCKEALKKFEK